MVEEIRTLRAANEVLSKRRRAKKTRVREGGAYRVEDMHDILSQQEVDEQFRRDLRAQKGNQAEGKPSIRRCGTCGQTGHNARTCIIEENISSSSEFNL